MTSTLTFYSREVLYLGNSICRPEKEEEKKPERGGDSCGGRLSFSFSLLLCGGCFCCCYQGLLLTHFTIQPRVTKTCLALHMVGRYLPMHVCVAVGCCIGHSQSDTRAAELFKASPLHRRYIRLHDQRILASLCLEMGISSSSSTAAAWWAYGHSRRLRGGEHQGASCRVRKDRGHLGRRI